MGIEPIYAKPPRFDEMDAVFHIEGHKGIIITYGDKVYMPFGGTLSPALKQHEAIHIQRQTTDLTKINAWWDKYLVSPEFRIQEETPAHKAEYHAYCNLVKDRNQRSRYLDEIARRLSGTLYGGLMTLQEARRAIMK